MRTQPKALKANPKAVKTKPMAVTTKVSKVTPAPKTSSAGASRVKTAPLTIEPLPQPASDSKQSQLIASLRTDPGVSIRQLMDLTGWQAHTVRGTISGALRKKLGLAVICESRNASGERLYRIEDAA